jgi:hypothetical protein
MMVHNVRLKGAARGGTFLYVGFLALGLYALSFGPALRMLRAGIVSGPTLIRLYRPLYWVVRYDESRLYVRYLDLWLPVGTPSP